MYNDLSTQDCVEKVFPYFFSDGRNLVGFLRTPRFESSLKKSFFVRDVLEKLNIDFTAAIIHSEQSSYLTLPTRLYPYLKDGVDLWS